MFLNMLKELKGSKKDLIINGFFLFIALHFFADFLCKLNHVYNLNFPQYNRILKGVFLCLSLICSIYFSLKEKKINPFLFFTLIFSLFFLKIVFLGNMETFIRYFFWIGTLPFFFVLYKLKESHNNFISKTYNLFRIIILLNVISIIIALTFKLNFSLTYDSSRFGYNGFLLNQMQTPYFYLAALFLFQKKRDNLFLIITIVLSVLSGVKAIYLGLFLFFLLRIVFFNKRSVSFKKQAVLIGIVTLVFVGGLYILLQSRIFSDLVSKHGIITALTSTRNFNLIAIVNEINSQNFNFFIGSISLTSYRSEFGIIDVFLFFGFLGITYYFFLLRYLYLVYANNKLAISYFLINFIVVIFAGNFFYFPFNCILFTIGILFIMDWKAETV
jgi:hypothetical protein